MNQELERQYIKEIMEYFKEHELDEEGIMLLRHVLEALFKLEFLGEFAKEASENTPPEDQIEIKFIKDENMFGFLAYKRAQKGESAQIIVNEVSPYYKGLESKDAKERVFYVKKIISGLFHEIQHSRQFFFKTMNISNKHTLMFAKEDCMISILEDRFYSMDKDKGNYCDFLQENDANIVGLQKYKSITQDDDESIKRALLWEKFKFYNGTYLINIDTSDGKRHFEHIYRVERIDAANEILDETIKPWQIITNTILQKEYNLDGTRKHVVELIKNLRTEIMQIISFDKIDEESKNILIKDAQEMYYEIVYKSLEKEGENAVAEMKHSFGIQDSLKFFEEMKEYFNKEKELRNKVTMEYSENLLEDSKDNEEESERIKLIAEKGKLRVNRYYDGKIDFLSNLAEKLYTITPLSITHDTINAKVGKVELELLTTQLIPFALSLRQVFDER